MATHSSILAWRIPIDRGAWRATAHRVTKSQIQLNDEACHVHIYIYICIHHMHIYMCIYDAYTSICIYIHMSTTSTNYLQS